ncbi:MAG: CAP domain-containing protein [Thermoplasmata archaeon]
MEDCVVIKYIAASIILTVLFFMGLLLISSDSCSAYDVWYPSEVDLRILQMVNENRTVAGLNPLSLNSTLCWAARATSRHQIDYDYFNHTSSNDPPFYGATFDNRLRNASVYSLGHPDGYFPNYTGSAVGENIAFHTSAPDAARVMQMWRDSPPHWANIMNPLFTEIGIGHFTGEFIWNGTVYPETTIYAQEFGRQDIQLDVAILPNYVYTNPTNFTPADNPKVFFGIFNTGSTDAYKIYWNATLDNDTNCMVAEGSLNLLLPPGLGVLLNFTWSTWNLTGNHSLYISARVVFWNSYEPVMENNIYVLTHQFPLRGFINATPRGYVNTSSPVFSFEFPYCIDLQVNFELEIYDSSGLRVFNASANSPGWSKSYYSSGDTVIFNSSLANLVLQERTYRWRAFLVDAGNTYCMPDTFFTVDITPPAPYIISPEISVLSRFNVSWGSANSSQGSPVIEYRIEVYNNSNHSWFEWIVSPQPGIAEWYSSENGILVRFRITATDLAGNTALYGAEASTYISLLTPSATASSENLFVSDGRAGIQWKTELYYNDTMVDIFYYVLNSTELNMIHQEMQANGSRAVDFLNITPQWKLLYRNLSMSAGSFEYNISKPGEVVLFKAEAFVPEGGRQNKSKPDCFVAYDTVPPFTNISFQWDNKLLIKVSSADNLSISGPPVRAELLYNITIWHSNSLNASEPSNYTNYTTYTTYRYSFTRSSDSVWTLDTGLMQGHGFIEITVSDSAGNINTAQVYQYNLTYSHSTGAYIFSPIPLFLFEGMDIKISILYTDSTDTHLGLKAVVRCPESALLNSTTHNCTAASYNISLINGTGSWKIPVGLNSPFAGVDRNNTFVFVDFYLLNTSEGVPPVMSSVILRKPSGSILSAPVFSNDTGLSTWFLNISLLQDQSGTFNYIPAALMNYSYIQLPPGLYITSGGSYGNNPVRFRKFTFNNSSNSTNLSSWEFLFSIHVQVLSFNSSLWTQWPVPPPVPYPGSEIFWEKTLTPDEIVLTEDGLMKIKLPIPDGTTYYLRADIIMPDGNALFTVYSTPRTPFSTKYLPPVEVKLVSIGTLTDLRTSPDKRYELKANSLLNFSWSLFNGSTLRIVSSWDFNGDGLPEYEEENGTYTTYIFKRTGIFDCTLTITRTGGIDSPGPNDKASAVFYIKVLEEEEKPPWWWDVKYLIALIVIFGIFIILMLIITKRR